VTMRADAHGGARVGSLNYSGVLLASASELINSIADLVGGTGQRTASSCPTHSSA